MARSTQDIERLAEDVHNLLLSKKQLLAQAEGKITLEAYPTGTGFDCKLSLTTK